MLANWITLSRVPLLLLSLVGLYQVSPTFRLVSVVLVSVGLLLDTVDGVVARRTGRSSLFGSVLDIALDRMYELALWVAFADLGMVPVAIPLIVITRTALTDAVRSIGVGQGMAPFDQHRSAIGRFLVGSPWMRTGYSISKVAAFSGLALAHAIAAEPIGAAGLTLGWVAAGICVLRGLPVLLGSMRRYWRLAAATPR
jgi:phosphatidylglycerophosphate synthase